MGKKYLVLNDTTSAISKSSILKRHACKNNHINILLLLSGVLVGGYICTYIFHLLDFDMANILPFDTKYVVQYGTQQNTHLDFDMAEVVSFMMFYEQLLGTKYKQSLNDGSTELNKSNSNLI